MSKRDSAKRASASEVAASTEPARERGWWGEHLIPLDHRREWRIGPARLWIHHLAYEWRVSLGRGEREESEPGSVSEAVPVAPDEPLVGTPRRLIFESTSETVRVRPALADLPVVTRSELPLNVPAGQTVTFYAGTPLWVQVIFEDAGKPQIDEPVLPPMRSWFGPSTLRGEICYFSRTAARLHLDNLPPIQHRAVTPVTVRNRAVTPLVLERFKVPVLNLELFAGEGGFLWTNPITIERDDSGDSEVHLQHGPPSGAYGDEPVAPARQRPERRSVRHALSTLFG